MPDLIPVSTLNGKESPIPPVTPDAKKMSDERMSRLATHARRFAGAVVPNSEEEKERARREKAGEGGDNNSSASPAKEDPKPPAPTGKEGEGEPPKKDDKANPPAKEPEKTPAGSTNWEELSKGHQSRADKAEQRLADLEKELNELKPYKEQVTAFTSDPMTFITKNLPNLAKQLASAGDPIKMVETEMVDFQKELDKQFFQTFGEDWRFDQTEAMRPGTPSFRYKLALDDRLTDIRTRYRNFADESKRKAELAERAVQEDKQRLEKDFGLTAEDFAAADRYVSEKNITYYDLVKAILIDKIIQQKISVIAPPPPISRDITSGPKGGDHTTPTKVKVSEEGMRLIARFGRAALK